MILSSFIVIILWVLYSTHEISDLADYAQISALAIGLIVSLLILIRKTKEFREHRINKLEESLLITMNAFLMKLRPPDMVSIRNETEIKIYRYKDSKEFGLVFLHLFKLYKALLCLEDTVKAYIENPKLTRTFLESNLSTLHSSLSSLDYPRDQIVLLMTWINMRTSFTTRIVDVHQLLTYFSEKGNEDSEHTEAVYQLIQPDICESRYPIIRVLSQELFLAEGLVQTALYSITEIRLALRRVMFSLDLVRPKPWPSQKWVKWWRDARVSISELVKPHFAFEKWYLQKAHKYHQITQKLYEKYTLLESDSDSKNL